MNSLRLPSPHVPEIGVPFDLFLDAILCLHPTEQIVHGLFVLEECGRDEAERVARLIGNNRSRFYGIDLKTATAEDIRARIGIEQFDIVLYLAMDSFFGHLPEYLHALTGELLVYEKLIDNVSPQMVMKGLVEELGYRNAVVSGRIYDSPLSHEKGNYIIKAIK